MGTSSGTAVEKVAIFAIKGTLPLPIGWSRPVVSRTNEHGKQEFAVANSQDLIWRSIDSLAQFEEEGFLTILNAGTTIRSQEVGESWILYVNESQLKELPATASVLQLFHEEIQRCPHQHNSFTLSRADDQEAQNIQCANIHCVVVTKSCLDTFRSNAFKALFDEIVSYQLSRKSDFNLLHQASLMLVDLASSETDGANGIALSLSLLFETDNAAQAQHWLSLVCTKFGFASEIKEWQLRAESLMARCRFLSHKKLLVEKYLDFVGDRFFVGREFEAQSSVRMADDFSPFLTIGNRAIEQHAVDNSMFGGAPVGLGQIAGVSSVNFLEGNAKFMSTRTLPGSIIVNTDSNRQVISCFASGEWFRYAINAELLSEFSGTFYSGVTLKIPTAQLDMYRKNQ